MSLYWAIRKTLIPLAVVLAISAWLYFDRLDFAPPHIQIDEAMIAVNAHSIAHTGRDLRGERLPMYVQTAGHSWYQPIVIYVNALALKLLPLDERTVRLPAVTFAMVDIVLLFWLVRVVYSSTLLAAVAAILLSLSPGHFMHSRYGMDYHYPIAFILAWLLCLFSYLQRPRRWLLAAATAILGIGFYCYISSIVMMPLYFLLTLMILRERKSPREAYTTAALAFGLLLIPFVVWMAGHPSTFAHTVDKYGLYDTQQLSAWQGLRSMFSYLGMSARLSQFWNYFDPSLLFFGAGIKVQFSTNLAGVFLLPVAVFLIAGVWDAITNRADIFPRVALIGFITAPLAAVIPTEENAVFRALGLLPFGVLLATIGVRRLWPPSSLSAGAIPLRLVTSGLLVLIAVQFAAFRDDYFTSYRERVGFWLGGNIRGALEEVIDRVGPDTATRVYFTPLTATSGQADWRNDFLDTYWRFYLIKHHREDLLERTSRVETRDLASIPPGSIVLGNSENGPVHEMARAGGSPATAIPELDGRTFFEVFRR